jgi:(5-formylfuran-3-yl)methyl phosphate synthase
MTGMLASVTSLNEASALVPLTIDILDLKNPALGALGALELLDVQRIVETFPDQCISATVGDLPMVPEVIARAVDEMAGTGVDYVKIGFFESESWQAVLDQLSPIAARGVKLVAVFFGDQSFSLGALPAFKTAGFHGIMVDTADKTRGGLLYYRDLSWLHEFVNVGQSMGCLTGLAGSLSLRDIPVLKSLGADYLGFRGALCAGSRTDALDLSSAAEVRSAMAAIA